MPISLCNFSSKVVMKLMVVRMPTVLPRVLSPQQSGFVAGQSITDNVLLASEICHGLSLQSRDIVLKLDMAKAYDRYSVIVNGIKEGFFTSTRGLRQGDPLSPTLFVIAAEVLSVYLAHVYDGTTVPQFTQPPGTPHIHHLAYADDVIIFSTTRLGAVGKLSEDRKKCIYFTSIVDKVKAKCLSWQRRVLSKRGKAILVLSVLQAIPLHMFSACAPPKQVIWDLERCFASFFWKQTGGARYHWSSWKTLSLPKKEGELGSWIRI
ncbi:PREDICTED: uncharacterized protein LOC109192010 [Ipomoea nil]|uniref:uncharacterized protein LOC109192010 n=1 Tax=Ipomoea nil TaxID=35883 RepID=UPI000901F311|nr:PREDICTED: uncharacterized protein LOC109192010 [Ipomoea nil]